MGDWLWAVRVGLGRPAGFFDAVKGARTDQETTQFAVVGGPTAVKSVLN